MRMRNNLTFTCAVVLLSACGTTDSGSQPAPSNSLTSSTPSVSASPSPSQFHEVPICDDAFDNSNLPVKELQATDTIYYIFGCDGDRVIVRIQDGKGYVVHAPLQSEYTFGTLSFDETEPVETILYENQTQGESLLVYWGTSTDLHMKKLARVVGPTLNVSDFAEQDCKDYKVNWSKKDCSTMDRGYADYFTQGDEAGWLNASLGD